MPRSIPTTLGVALVILALGVPCPTATLAAQVTAESASATGSAPVPAHGALPRAAAPPDTPLTFDPAVRRGTLPNGLSYYVRPNSRPENRAELRLVVHTGSVMEDSLQHGLAHFVEHMAFNGTQRFEKQALVQYLESVGSRFGADVNAYTSFDETVYTLTVPTDSADVLARGLDILAEWAHAVTFDSLEIERERPVVIEEWRQGQGAASRMRDKQFPILFAGSAYASQLPIGTLSSLQSFSHRDLTRFYNEWYRPELMAVIAVGDFDPDTMEAHVRELFGAIPERTGAERRIVQVPAGDSTRFSIVADPEATSSQIGVLWMHEPDRVRTLSDYRRRLARAIYGTMLDARLAELAQQPDAPYLAASSAYGSLVPARDAYSLGAVVADTGIRRGLEAVLVEAERVARHGFTEGEFERARADILRGAELSYAERERTSSGAYAEAFVRSFLNDEPVTDAELDLALHQQLLPAVTLDEINALAATWTGTDDLVVLVSAPERPDVDLPGAGELQAILQRAGDQTIAVWEDNVLDEPLVEVVPNAGRVVESSTNPTTGVTEWLLDNGARVLLKPTRFKDDEVLFRAWSAGGTSMVPDSLHITASFAPSIVQLGGLGTFDMPQLEKALAGSAANASPAIGEREESISGSASPRDLETMLQLAHLYFTAPRADTAAYVALLQRVLPLLENRVRSPESAFSDTLQVVLADYHPRALPLTADRLNELDFNAAISIYRERFASAADFNFAFVGTFEPDSIRHLVELWIGGLPGGGDREVARDVGIRRPTGVERRIVRRGSEPRSITQIVLSGPAPYSLENQANMAGLSEILGIRLREALREELGGTYGASVSGSLQLEPEEGYTVAIGFGSSPERVEELTSVVFAQLDSLRSFPPSEDELRTVKTLMTRSRETSMRQNGFWLNQIVAYDRIGAPLELIFQGEKRIEALTTGRIQRAAASYLDPSRFVQVTLLPAIQP